jgi:hypothetical protein
MQEDGSLYCLMDTEDEARCFAYNEEDHMITSCPLMKDQEHTSPMMSIFKKNGQQASCQTERRFCYKCGKQGHLKKVWSLGKIPKLGNSFHSYSLRRPIYYNCARTTISSPRTNTNAIWVPKALLADVYGPILRWAPKCAP